MDNKKAGGCAFPDPGRAQSAKQRENLTETGMSLRDYFAAKVMQALISNAHLLKADMGNEMIAASAYKMADAMLAERAK